MRLLKHLVLHDATLRGTGGGIVRDALAHGFEVIVARVVEDDVVLVTGLHAFAGRFVARFTIEGGVLGDAKVTAYGEAWTITPDLRSSDTSTPSAKRKPAGIGVEKLTRLDGIMKSTALRAWIKEQEM